MKMLINTALTGMIAFAIHAQATTPPKNLIILLDLSASTPLADSQMQKRIYEETRTQISKLRPGDFVKVYTLGDDSQSIVSKVSRIQEFATAEGNTKEALAKSVPAMLTQYVATTAKSQRLHGQSALTNGIWDAASEGVCGQSCTLVFFTDGFQNTRNGVHYPKDYKKPLPALRGLDLSRMKVHMIGVGSGLESDADTRIEIEIHWKTWLKQAGAKEPEVRRI